MSTIYEKEALFESLDDMVARMKQYVREAVGQKELHEVEQDLLRSVHGIGRLALEAFVRLTGSGYEPGNLPVTETGDPMRYKGTVDSPYVSIFGEISIARAAYAHPGGGRVYPIDAHLNLPAHQYSYLLLKWMQADGAEKDFRKAVNRFNEIFDFSFFPELPQRQGLPIAEYVEPFYEQVEAPSPETEGSHIALSADCKGVRILKGEREDAKAQEEAFAKPRRGKGEKPGIKKDAVVVTDFSFDPEVRDPEEIVKGLLNQFTRKEKEQQKQDRKHRREEGLPEPREPFNKHIFATLEGKKAAFDHLLDHVQKRDPEGQKPLVVLLDGDPYLEDPLLDKLKARNMHDRLDALILDLIHASEYLWDVGTSLYGEKGHQRINWVEEKLYALLDGKVNYIIGGLRQMQTKKQDQLTPAQKTALKKTTTYFDNHRHMMHYDVYLKKGYPLATGVIEGTCGSLVKDRMENSGMRWSIAGARAVLAQRTVVKNGDWNNFFKFYIDSERERLYSTVHQREAGYEKAA